jgi:hypothetical protein
MNKTNCLSIVERVRRRFSLCVRGHVELSGKKGHGNECFALVYTVSFD